MTDFPTRAQIAELVRELRDPNDTGLRYKALAADYLEALVGVNQQSLQDRLRGEQRSKQEWVNRSNGYERQVRDLDLEVARLKRVIAELESR